VKVQKSQEFKNLKFIEIYLLLFQFSNLNFTPELARFIKKINNHSRI